MCHMSRKFFSQQLLALRTLHQTPRSTQLSWTSRKSFITLTNPTHPAIQLSRLVSSNFCRLETKSLSSMDSDSKTLVAVCQLNSINDKEKNFAIASSIVTQAANVGAKMIFLPECFNFIGANREETIASAEALDGPTMKEYQNLAKKLKVWLSLGGMSQISTEDSQVQQGAKKSLNAHIILDSEGKIRSIYHKVHLFNLEIPNVVRLIEGESYVAGNRLPEPVRSPIGKVGLGVCYDLRFGEMALAYAKAGADVLTYPSSFTVPTGIHHWEPLIRARAIETQCYVIAAAQVGAHNPKRASFGHAMIVDPWGTKIAECSDGEGFAIGLIDHEFKARCRSRLPIWTDRRYDIYADIEPAIDSYEIDGQAYKFQDMNLPSSQVFARTRYSFAFVNHRPVLDGHVLVSPLRVCDKYKDLSPAEVTDLMLLAQKVERMLERKFQTGSTTIVIQDGPDAGQSVFHTHVHLMPRKPTDFGGNVDKVYSELKMHDKKEFKQNYRKLTADEMAVVAAKYREDFSHL